MNREVVGGLVWTSNFRSSGSTVRHPHSTPPLPPSLPSNMNPITVINLPVYYAQTFYPTSFSSLPTVGRAADGCFRPFLHDPRPLSYRFRVVVRPPRRRAASALPGRREGTKGVCEIISARL